MRNPAGSSSESLAGLQVHFCPELHHLRVPLQLEDPVMSSVPGCWQASVPYWLLAGGLHLLSSKSLHRLPESLYDMAKASLRASDEREKNPRQKLSLL